MGGENGTRRFEFSVADAQLLQKLNGKPNVFFDKILTRV